MIVTVTPNPSIDRTITVEDLRLGEVNRASSSRIDPGGKGVNVSRALHANGLATLAVLPLGGEGGQALGLLLQEAGLEHIAVIIRGNTRTNTAIVDSLGRTTKVNDPGPPLSEAELISLTAAIPRGADWVVLCGSLPDATDGSPLGDVVSTHPGRVAVDTSGPSLAAAVAARPYLIKPNREELEELLGVPLPTIGAVRAACRELVAGGVSLVVASLGSDGALLTSAEGQWAASASVSNPRSTVGAGDCLLAGVISALHEGLHPELAIARGVAWGSAAVSLPGSRVPGPADIARVTVTSNIPDDSRALT